MTLETLRQKKKAELFFSVQQKRQKIYCQAQAEDNFLKINEMATVLVEWDVCMITKTYSSVLKLF